VGDAPARPVPHDGCHPSSPRLDSRRFPIQAPFRRHLGSPQIWSVTQISHLSLLLIFPEAVYSFHLPSNSIFAFYDILSQPSEHTPRPDPPPGVLKRSLVGLCVCAQEERGGLLGNSGQTKSHDCEASKLCQSAKTLIKFQNIFKPSNHC